MFFAWSSNCDGYFLCVYSWDHWYQFSYLIGVIRYYFSDWFDIRSWRSWIAAVGLFLLMGWAVSTPFVFANQIVEVTLLASLYYAIFCSGVSLALLNIQYSPEGEE
jgi:hypothetical protein